MSATHTESSEASVAWRSRIGRELLRLSLPISASSLSFISISLVDALFLGRVGTQVLAGVTLGATATFASFCFCLGFSRAVLVILPHARGVASDVDVDVRPYVGASVALAVLSGLAAFGLSVVGTRLAPLVLSDPEVRTAATEYWMIRAAGIPVVCAGASLSCARYASGMTKLASGAQIVANLVNCFLCAIVLGVYGGGAAAAAWCANAAALVALVPLVVRAGPDRVGPRVFAREHLKTVARRGAPLGLQAALDVGSQVVCTMLVASTGPAQVSAFFIAVQICEFSFAPIRALGDATSMLIGRALGGGVPSLARRVAAASVRVGGAYLGVWGVVFFLFADALCRPFSGDPKVVSVATSLVTWIAPFLGLVGGHVLGQGALNGAADVRWTSRVSPLVAWSVVPLGTWVFAHRLGLGALGAWIALGASSAILAVLFWWRFLTQRWMRAAAALKAELVASR